MRFRREDLAYAGATTVAAALVAFLVAGNFGLVPTPLAPAGLDNRPPVGIPALRTQPTTDETQNTAVDDDLVPNVSSPQPPNVVAAPDTQPPSVSISTADGSVVVALSEGAFRGSATDDLSGIDRVIVTFDGELGGRSTSEAALACSSPRSCTWSADAPAPLDDYQVTARAFDRKGNSSKSDTVSVTVVSASPGEPSIMEDLAVPDVDGAGYLLPVSV